MFIPSAIFILNNKNNKQGLNCTKTALRLSIYKKKIRDTVTGGSVLASGAQPPESVANFFRWVRVEPCDSICFDIQPIFDYTEPCNSICYNIETCDIIYYHIEPCLLILEFGGAMRP